MNSTANYGSIPTTTSSTSFLSTLRHTRSTLTTHRQPWPQFLSLTSLSLPISYRESLSRIKHNTLHFRTNYLLITLFILFVSLLYHPISLIIFLIIFVAWLGLYLFRNEPLRVWNWIVSENVVVIGLGVLTVVALVLSGVGLNVLVALCVAVVVVGVHAVCRGTEDGYLDEECAVEGGLVSVVGSSVPMKSSSSGGYSRF